MTSPILIPFVVRLTSSPEDIRAARSMGRALFSILLAALMTSHGTKKGKSLARILTFGMQLEDFGNLRR